MTGPARQTGEGFIKPHNSDRICEVAHRSSYPLWSGVAVAAARGEPNASPLHERVQIRRATATRSR